MRHLSTPDIDRQIDYFTQIAGLTLTERENGRAFLATKLGDLAVQLEKGDHARCARLAFQVAPDTEFDDIRRGVEAEGVRCQTRNDPTPGIPRMLAFEDPKGTVCEVFAAQTPIGKNQQVPGIGPIEALAILRSWFRSRRSSPRSTRRVLGFRVSDWIQDWFVFIALRCGSSHREFRARQAHADASHRFRVEGLGSHPGRLRLPWRQEHPHHLGTRPARARPQRLHLSPQSRRPDRQRCSPSSTRCWTRSLGYFDPRPWHRDRPQAPKVWSMPTDIWGPPPTQDYLRQRRRTRRPRKTFRGAASRRRA